jgi:exodeoxyribonuclease-3
MRIATWNVNSVRQRLEGLLDFLKKEDIDVCCLQEIKCRDEDFPRDALEQHGYTLVLCGQKSYNGVAVLSKVQVDSVETLQLPGDKEDVQARYLEVLLPTPKGRILRLASIYAPNGNPIGTQKFTYKLAWMDRLQAHVNTLVAYEEILVLAGDYNIIPELCDAAHPEQWEKDALFQPESRAHFRKLKNKGLIDAVRACTDDPAYTFWGYQGQAWRKNNGIRIDHMLLSPHAADSLKRVNVLSSWRSVENASDHVPLWVDLDI